MDFETMKHLSEAHGVSGFEDEIRKIIREYAKGYFDEVREDNLGNLIFKVGRGNKHVLIEAHMDEVGIVVKYIDDKGFIYFAPLGGLDPYTLVSQRFRFKDQNNNIFYGVCGTKPIHLREEEDNEKIRIKDLYLDIGAKSKDDVKKMGVSLGDVWDYDISFTRLGEDFVTGKALDNRTSCYAALEIMKKVYGDEELKNKFTFYFAFTAQEEVGLKGARVVAFEDNIDYAIVLDTSAAGDTPGIDGKLSHLKLGEGIVIDYIQAEGRGLIMRRRDIEKIRKILEKNNISYQVEIGVGGVSDAAIVYITKEGIPTIGLGVAVRYLHTPIEVASVKDIDNLIDATYLLLKEGVWE